MKLRNYAVKWVKERKQWRIVTRVCWVKAIKNCRVKSKWSEVSEKASRFRRTCCFRYHALLYLHILISQHRFSLLLLLFSKNFSRCLWKGESGRKRGCGLHCYLSEQFLGAFFAAIWTPASVSLENKRSRKRRGLVLTIPFGFFCKFLQANLAELFLARPARAGLLALAPATPCGPGFPLPCSPSPLYFSVCLSVLGYPSHLMAQGTLIQLRITAIIRGGNMVFTTASSWSLTAVSEGVRRSKCPGPGAYGEWWRAARSGKVAVWGRGCANGNCWFAKSFLAFSWPTLPLCFMFWGWKAKQEEADWSTESRRAQRWSGSFCWQEMAGMLC